MPIEELTVEEQATLEELNDKNPDKPRDNLSWSPDEEQSLLASLFGHKEVTEFACQHLKPKAFLHEARSLIFRLVQEHWKTHQEVPTHQAIRWQIEEMKRQDKLPGKKPDFFFIGEINCIQNEYLPTAWEAKRFMAKIEEYARLTTYRDVYRKETGLILEGKWDEVIANRKNYELPTLSIVGAMETWATVLEAANNQQEDWFIPNWSEYGCMTLFSSKPKLGKSTIIAEMITCAMLEREFYGMKLNPAPVLLVDPENRQKTLVRRLNYAMAGQGTGNFDKWFFRLGDFPKPLTLELLETTIKNVKKHTASSKLIVVLDTLRSCFAGEIEDENDAAGMAKVLTPLKDLAAKHNACLFLIHHNTKSADDYSGSTAILGSVDYHWNWRNDRLKCHGELYCQGRGDYVDPIELQFDPETQRNRLYVAKANPQTDLELVAIPMEGAGVVTTEELMVAWGASRRTVQRRLKDLGDVIKRVEPSKITDKVGFCRCVK